MPVIFDESYNCAFYDMAYSTQLPRQRRTGFGAGDWSVLLNAELASRDAGYTFRELRRIPDGTYLQMLRSLVRMQRRIVYSARNTTKIDGVNSIVRVLTSRHDNKKLRQMAITTNRQPG